MLQIIDIKLYKRRKLLPSIIYYLVMQVGIFFFIILYSKSLSPPLRWMSSVLLQFSFQFAHPLLVVP